MIDNSKYAINGDILPSRFDAQTDALSLLASTKLDENQESSVGLMTMGGRNIEVWTVLNRLGLADPNTRERANNGLYKQDRGLRRIKSLKSHQDRDFEFEAPSQQESKAENYCYGGKSFGRDCQGSGGDRQEAQEEPNRDRRDQPR